MSDQSNQQKLILLIDDDIDLQQLVKITLKSKGYQVETANNGLEGLEKLKTLAPHLIILDMNMPKMGGLEFYKSICDGGNHPRYPILVLTARANMEQLFRELNIDGFMAKPFEISALLEEVDTILKKRSGIPKIIMIAEGQHPHEVCIAENNSEMFTQIGAAFLNAGFVVNPARTGIEAIERISATVPDAAVIKLGLADVAGDMVILKIKKMAKTQNIRCVLYTEKNAEKAVIAEKIGSKDGIDRFVIYSGPQQLIDVVNELLKDK